jgi:GNAT superfamily N-acetyltransferase
MTLPMVPRPAQPSERPGAFDLLFSHLPGSERVYRVMRALELTDQEDLDSKGIFILPDLAGVCVCQPVVGAGALIWPPVARIEPREALEDQLIRHACDWVRQQGARLIQCLLGDKEEALSSALLRNGFRRITGLTYLRHDLQLDVELVGTPVRLTMESYDLAHPEVFHHTLLRTYEQTLDCPEVNGIRTIDEVIAGHKAQGRFDPSHWWLARRNDEPVGVMMIAEPDGGIWEVAYMGVIPEARRQGVGRELLLHVLCEARAGGIHQVILSVDDRNLRARQLYETTGFQLYDHRIVLLSI